MITPRKLDLAAIKARTKRARNLSPSQAMALSNDHYAMLCLDVPALVRAVDVLSAALKRLESGADPQWRVTTICRKALADAGLEG